MVGGVMKKNALRKDFFMEIRKSMGRFLSIFFIVALGVSLFVGIRATQPDMILSGDAYVDENKLMDIKVVSTYGLTEEDVDVIGRLPAIESAQGAYSVDVLCDEGDNKKVIHVMSHTEDMNLVTIEKGRLPKTAEECLVDQDFLESTDYKIGDRIVVESGTDAALTDTLKRTEFKIVGTGNSPLYFSLDRGSSTIGNGSVGGFMVVMPEAFELDVYTEIYAMVDGAEDVLSFTEEYDTLIDEATQQIELIQNVRCEVRRDDLAQEAMLQIDDARKAAAAAAAIGDAGNDAIIVAGHILILLFPYLAAFAAAQSTIDDTAQKFQNDDEDDQIDQAAPQIVFAAAVTAAIRTKIKHSAPLLHSFYFSLCKGNSPGDKPRPAGVPNALSGCGPAGRRLTGRRRNLWSAADGPSQQLFLIQHMKPAPPGCI